jgi:hypothetical protein
MSARLLLTLLAVAASLGVMTAGEISSCASSGTYTDGSQYEKNLAELLAELSSAAAAGNGSFHSASVGSAAPDQAWGLAMCYADCNATRCQDCLREVASIGGLTELCPDAAHSRNVSFSDSYACLLRYADAPFLGSADTDDRWQSSSGFDVDVADMASMNTTRWRLLSQLAERAAGQDQPQRLAYGSLEYTDARNGSHMVVYGLAQCTGDLEPSECTRCLTYFLAEVSSGDMTNATRRSVWGFSCYLRYQVNDPIDVIAGPLAPSPQPVAPSGRSRYIAVIIYKSID